MTLTRGQVLAVGALTLWPAVYVVLFIASVFGLIAFAGVQAGTTPGADPGAALPVGVVVLFAAHCLTLTLAVALVVFYVVHAARSPALDSQARVVWIVVLLLGGMLAMGVYWYLQLWRPLQGPRAAG